MRIALLGARGNIGHCVLEEAIGRGYEVSALVRSGKLAETATSVIGDAENRKDVASFVKDHDIIISALRPREGQEERLVLMTQSVLCAARQNDIRVIITGGAARLRISEKAEHTVLTAPGFLPDAVRPIALACQAQYETCLAEEDARWTYVSPPSELTAGMRTGQYRTGLDILVRDDSGRSRVSYTDFAVALIDEAERAQHVNSAFTVGY